MPHNRSSQSALEYMMTYGWAILIIVIVAGALYSLGIFNPSASAGTTITGFSGFQTTAVCAPNGTMVIELGNELGYVINITQLNFTYNGKTTLNTESAIISPGASYTFSSLNGCTRSATTRFSTSVAVTYTELGRIFPGPYFSSGTIAGVSSSFMQNTVANFTNSSSVGSNIQIANSTSMYNIFHNRPSYTIVVWVNSKISGGNCNGGYPCDDMAQVDEGCTEGAVQSPYNSTHFGISLVEWDSFVWANQSFSCQSATASPTQYAPYNKWTMLTYFFRSNASSGGNMWYGTCVNTVCINSSYTLPRAGQYNFGTTEIGSNQFGGKMADFQIYDTVLTITQITTLYNLGYAGIPINFNYLTAWFPFAGNTVDYSSNSNTASLTRINWVSP